MVIHGGAGLDAHAEEQALELARAGLELAAAVSVHGRLATLQPARAGDIRTPILVCHGALDPHSPSTDVMSFVDEMNTATTDWQLVLYGGAQHGFTHEGATPTRGVAYDAAADRRSLEAIDRFLKEVFAA